MDWLLYSVAFLFLAGFVAIIYIRIKYPFWSFMDANHSYDWFLRQPNKPISVKPCRNKYVDRTQVKTGDQTDPAAVASTVASLLQRHLIPSDKILYECEAKHIEARTNTQISLHTHPLMDKPSGTIISYPVRISSKGEPLLVANYISHIAAEDDAVTRKLIATHIYNVHDKTPDKPAFLLKKDVGRCAGLRPLIPFTTTLFYIAERPKPMNTRNAATLVQVYKDNWHLIQDAIDRLDGLVVTIDIGSIQTRVKAGILFVYALMYRGTTIAVYFIEDALMLYEQVADHGGKTLRLLAIALATPSIASVQAATPSIANVPNTPPMDSIIYDGFCQCLAKIIKQNADYKMLLVDGIGANQMICKSLIEDKQMMRLTTTTGAYYFVNWAYRNVWESEKVFILV
uniref:Uncharacterized protein n=1 Tax=viral metagenome TaxID=1070528 RepID=A0A6C0B6A9_9ZZZZ